MTISIVTPSFNQGAFIKETIESVYSQDFTDFEHIIIDGGSTDNTLEILRRYPHLHWISEADNGQSDAINKGMKMASGQILAWQNSDDFYLPGAFGTVSEYFTAHPECMMLYGDCVIVDQQSKPLFYLNLPDWDFRRFITGRFCPLQPGVFFRREALTTVGDIDTSLNYVMDVDLFARIAQRFKIHHIPILLGGFRAHQEGKSTNHRNKTDLYREFESVAFRYVPRGSRTMIWIHYYRLRNRIGYYYRTYVEKDSVLSVLRKRLMQSGPS